jgi:ABC-type uncharacterized transport system permease subunit
MSGTLFFAHVSVLLLGIVCFCGASLTAFLYYLEHRQLKLKRPSRLSAVFPSLERLNRFTIRSLWIGFVFLTLGMITGLYLAHKRWHGDWVLNPKFLVSTASWLWYVILLLIRYRLGWRGGRFFAMMAGGFFFLVSAFVAIAVMTEYWGM